jgi:glycerophosphoryl diester phosphodiesterase
MVSALPSSAENLPLPREAQIGPRPFYLVDKMKDGPLKTELSQCTGPFHKSDFSIGHRGAALQFPEHSRESYLAAARMGAGVIECDVTFTKDKQLVCRHSQCDLHTTTNILSVPALAAKCTQPFSPADPATGKKASAKCCTSDITLAEFKQLSAKMDGFNPDAKTAEEYQNGTPRWRTDLYANSGTLMTHDESIALIKSLGAKFTPELKSPEVPMPFDGDYTQEKYARNAGRLQAGRHSPKATCSPRFQPRRHSLLGEDRAGLRRTGQLPPGPLRALSLDPGKGRGSPR